MSKRISHSSPIVGRRAWTAAKHLVAEAGKTSFDLFKITVPIGILTKILSDAGAIPWLGRLLDPCMGPLGLPGSMGLVWATALVTNLYAALVVFTALAPAAHVTVAQVTVLSGLILVAHNMGVELLIARKAGPRVRIMFVWRMVGAVLFGLVLNEAYTLTGWLHAPNIVAWSPAPADSSWAGWLRSTAKTLLWIFTVVLSLMFLLKALKVLRVTDLIGRALQPFLTALGMSKDAAPLTIIGMLLGIAAGGGLIISEARSGRLGSRDVFFGLSLMGLCHSLIEDTTIMAMMGGHWSGILLGRIVFSLLLTWVLVQGVLRLSQSAFERWLFRTS